MQVLGDGGASIDALVDGAGAHTLVLLAGFPLAREIWDESAARLAHDHRVVRPDLRGAGASSGGDGPYLMESLAADVAAVLDALQCERASIAGHSLGGYVALAFARMFTERVERLALLCSRLRADTPEEARGREALARRLERGDENALVETYVPRLFSRATKRERPDVVQRVESLVGRANLLGSAALLRGMALRSASDDLAPDLAMPVLVLAGGEDAVVPLDESRRDAAAFANATLSIAARSGHMPMLEEPSATMDALSLWMGRMTPASESGS
jgi:3-oxoadipate enol-lactonase